MTAVLSERNQARLRIPPSPLSTFPRLLRRLAPIAAAVVASLVVAVAARAQAAADPVVSVQPELAVVPVNSESFEVRAFVAEVTNPSGLGGYDLFLRFDPAVIQAVSVTDSGFIGSTDNITFCLTPEIDNAAGSAVLTCLTAPIFVTDGPTTTAPQLLATAVFQPVAPGTSTLGLEGTALGDPYGAPLDVTLQGSQVTIVPAPAPPPEPGTPQPTGTIPAVVDTPTPTPTDTPTTVAPEAASPTPAASVAAAPPPATAPTLPPELTPQQGPAQQTTPRTTASPDPTATRLPGAVTVTPVPSRALPRTGDGPGGGSSWALPLALGLGTAAIAVGAAIGGYAWRTRRRGPTGGR